MAVRMNQIAQKLLLHRPPLRRPPTPLKPLPLVSVVQTRQPVAAPDSSQSSLNSPLHRQREIRSPREPPTQQSLPCPFHQGHPLNHQSRLQQNQRQQKKQLQHPSQRVGLLHKLPLLSPCRRFLLSQLEMGQHNSLIFFFFSFRVFSEADLPPFCLFIKSLLTQALLCLN